MSAYIQPTAMYRIVANARPPRTRAIRTEPTAEFLGGERLWA